MRALEQRMSMPQFQEWLWYLRIKQEREQEARQKARAESNRERAREML